MTIELKLIKEDGSVKKYSRPDTMFNEMEEFKDMKDELGKLQREVSALDRKEILDYDFRANEKKQDELAVNYIVDLFKPHDAFTAEEFRHGIKSKEYQQTLNDIFRQIDPSIPTLDEDKKKRSR